MSFGGWDGDPLSGIGRGDLGGGGFNDAGIEALFEVQQLEGFVLSLISAIAAVFGAILTFLKFLWDNFFKLILQHVKDVIAAAHKWLEDHLKPIIDFLKRIRALQQQYFNMYLRPILVMLQHIRQYLQILSLLHIQLATQLDNWIAGLQAKLVQQFAVINAAINTLTDVVNVLADSNYLFRKPALLLSIRRQLPALIHAVTGRPPGYWFPSPRGAAGGAFAPVGSNFVASDPTQNPPTSSYLGNDDGVGDLSGATALSFLGVASADDAQPLDYFNDSLYPTQLCTDGSGCWERVLMRNLNVSS